APVAAVRTAPLTLSPTPWGSAPAWAFRARRSASFLDRFIRAVRSTAERFAPMGVPPVRGSWSLLPLGPDVFRPAPPRGKGGRGGLDGRRRRGDGHRLGHRGRLGPGGRGEARPAVQRHQA